MINKYTYTYIRTLLAGLPLIGRTGENVARKLNKEQSISIYELSYIQNDQNDLLKAMFFIYLIGKN